MKKGNLIITDVDEASQAEQLGIKSGDIIVSYNGRPVSTTDEFQNAVLSANEKGIKDREIYILREGQEFILSTSDKSLDFNYSEISSNETNIHASDNVELVTHEDTPKPSGKVWGAFSWLGVCMIAGTAKMEPINMIGLLMVSVIFLGSVALIWRYYSRTRVRRNISARVVGYILFG